MSERDDSERDERRIAMDHAERDRDEFVYVHGNEFCVVCNACLRASCWKGWFYCDNYRTAGVTAKRVSELSDMALEHWSYWADHEK